MTTEERADLELVATDAFMLALYHLYLGKVDPLELSSQWNFPRAADRRRRAPSRGFRERLAAGPDPRGVRGARARSTRGTSSAASGCASTARSRRRAAGRRMPDGPVLKPGMSDPRVPVLRTPAAGDAGPVRRRRCRAPSRRQPRRHGRGPLRSRARDRRAGLPGTSRADGRRRDRAGHARGDERAGRGAHRPDPRQPRTRAAGRCTRSRASSCSSTSPASTSRISATTSRSGRPRSWSGRDERETPIFRSTITYVVFNPTWTIPPGILVKDKLPELQAQSRRAAGA